MHMHMPTCMCMRMYMHIRMHMHMHMYVRIRMHMYIYMHMRMHMHILTCACTCQCTCACTCQCTCACTCTCMSEAKSKMQNKNVHLVIEELDLLGELERVGQQRHDPHVDVGFVLLTCEKTESTNSISKTQKLRNLPPKLSAITSMFPELPVLNMKPANIAQLYNIIKYTENTYAYVHTFNYVYMDLCIRI